ncbi:two-component system sensor histidine kinase NtrB [Desulfosarcina sp.]|uniref:two-component system sensor histidine kinase NtrB n=1 Tax=Desulfosarcina sp. TaxID=2027861 RepID=UPI0039707485
MGFSLSTFFYSRRDLMISRWVELLKTEVGEQYAARPRQELMGTVSKAFDAEVDVILCNDYKKINAFITEITKMRLESGFLLSDVQKAFELFRKLAIDLLITETTLAEFSDSVVRMNDCLNYTIHRFSDYFQAMHEKKILEHNRLLEAEIQARTAELVESELNYKTLVEEINDGYFVVQNQVIVFANQAFCSMHGYALHEVLGSRYSDYVAPGELEKLVGTNKNGTSEQTGPRMVEYLRLTKTKEAFPTEIQSKVARYNNSISRIGICRDITNRVRLEKKMRESERMATIGQITTSLSHEIRNPLSAIKMNLQILKKNPQIRGNDQRRIDISAKEVNRLERILEEVLDFAKPLQIKLGRVEINTIVAASLDLLDMKFAEAGMEIVSALYPDLPTIQADGEKLGQAVINILLNALEASSYGSKAEIQTRFGSGSRGEVEIIIKDEGHGISRKHAPEIFKPFFTTKSSGTGLGLSNVHRIIDAHGGRIDVKNRRVPGAYFKITLPVNKGRGSG